MILSFTLTMPQNNAWNGKWTGDDKNFVKTNDFRTGRLANRNANYILYKRDFKYDFGDGWIANVHIEKVSVLQAAILKKKSDGFSTYEWMIESIMQHGKIQLEEKSK